LDKDSKLQTDILVAVGGYESKTLSKAVNELEGVLLIYSRQIHTERGKHARRLETWPHWAKRVGFEPVPMAAAAAKAQLGETVDAVNQPLQSTAKLPWRRLSKKS
jgi:predicted solute-binding protein